MKVKWTRDLLERLLSIHPTLSGVAKAVGVTPERVRQVAKRYGLTPTKGRLRKEDAWLLDVLPLADVIRLTGASRYRLRPAPAERPFRTWKNRCLRRSLLALSRDGEGQSEMSRWISTRGPSIGQSEVSRFITNAGKGVGRNARNRGHRPERAEMIRSALEGSLDGRQD